MTIAFRWKKGFGYQDQWTFLWFQVRMQKLMMAQAWLRKSSLSLKINRSNLSTVNNIRAAFGT